MTGDNYPAWVCLPCGIKYGHRDSGVSTWHLDTCPVCGRPDVPVTEPRDFGHLRPEWVNEREDRGNG